MNPKRRTCYGVYEISRQIARRVQKEWEAVESPALPPHFSPVVIALPPPDHPSHPPVGAEFRQGRITLRCGRLA